MTCDRSLQLQLTLSFVKTGSWTSSYQGGPTICTCCVGCYGAGVSVTTRQKGEHGGQILACRHCAAPWYDLRPSYSWQPFHRVFKESCGLENPLGFSHKLHSCRSQGAVSLKVPSSRYRVGWSAASQRSCSNSCFKYMILRQACEYIPQGLVSCCTE